MQVSLPSHHDAAPQERADLFLRGHRRYDALGSAIQHSSAFHEYVLFSMTVNQELNNVPSSLAQLLRQSVAKTHWKRAVLDDDLLYCIPSDCATILYITVSLHGRATWE
jgi:hypothetical protein